MKKLRYTIILSLIVSVYGCMQQNNSETGQEQNGHAHDNENIQDGQTDSDEEVHLVQQQMDVMGIELGKFQHLNLSTTVKSSGRLELPPQNKASLSALLGGRVKSVGILEGDYVRKGQVLAQLEHPDFVEMQEKYMMAKSRLNFVEQDYLRKKSLYLDSISSSKSFQKAESEYHSALAVANGLKARLQMLDIDPISVEAGNFLTAIPVKSPINGYVRHVKINMGKFIQPEEEMFEIVDNEHIHIDLAVYEKDMNKVKNGQKVIFSLSNNPDSVFNGSIFAVGKSFEQEHKAMIVHAEIENNTGDLLPGMYVDARIVTNNQTVRVLPNDAMVNDGGLTYIFALKPSSEDKHSHEDNDKSGNGNNKEGHSGHVHENEYQFRKIEVNTGATDIGFTEVVPAYNLPDHVKIVTKGAFYLLAELKKGENGHGHHH